MLELVYGFNIDGYEEDKPESILGRYEIHIIDINNANHWRKVEAKADTLLEEAITKIDNIETTGWPRWHFERLGPWQILTDQKRVVQPGSIRKNNAGFMAILRPIPEPEFEDFHPLEENLYRWSDQDHFYRKGYR